MHTITWIHLNQTHLRVIRSSSPYAKADTSHHSVSGLVHTKRTANDSTAYHILLTSLLFTSCVLSSMCFSSDPQSICSSIQLWKLPVWDPFALQFINKHLWFTLTSVWILLSHNRRPDLYRWMNESYSFLWLTLIPSRWILPRLLCHSPSPVPWKVKSSILCSGSGSLSINQWSSQTPPT